MKKIITSIFTFETMVVGGTILGLLIIVGAVQLLLYVTGVR